MTRVVLSMGSNLGDRHAHLAQAVSELAKQAEVLEVSSIYETPPWGPVPQGDFYNIVVIAASGELDPYGWLALCRELEESAGRRRDIRWGPRTLDVDMVCVDEIDLPDPDLTLPHPRAFERVFVLLPWAEVDPEAVLPGYGPVADLLAAMDASDVEMVGRVG